MVAPPSPWSFPGKTIERVAFGFAWLPCETKDEGVVWLRSVWRKRCTTIPPSGEALLDPYGLQAHDYDENWVRL